MITAIVLAAGQSKRMGHQKLVLSWGETTVIRQVISVLQDSGLDEILVVVGGDHKLVEEVLAGLPVRIIFNPTFGNCEMLDTLKLGIEKVNPDTQGILIVLGDQPQIRQSTVDLVLKTYQDGKPSLVIPSYQMRRGHPWLVDRILWPEILAIQSPLTLRDFLNQHLEMARYVEVKEDSVLRDLDTPADYLREKPTD
jgi:molybdenum cofactor cytidylyltransferase